MKLPNHVSESVKRLNPDVFGVGGVENPKRQSSKRRESENQQLERSATGLGWRVTIVSFRKRLVDAHDNLRTGCKPLVDAITASLGFVSDDNPRLTWEYQQIKTSGLEGTLVKLDRIEVGRTCDATNLPESV